MIVALCKWYFGAALTQKSLSAGLDGVYGYCFFDILMRPSCFSLCFDVNDFSTMAYLQWSIISLASWFGLAEYERALCRPGFYNLHPKCIDKYSSVMIRRIYPYFATGIELEGTTDKHMGIDPPPSGFSFFRQVLSPPFKIKSLQTSPVRRKGTACTVTKLRYH